MIKERRLNNVRKAKNFRLVIADVDTITFQTVTGLGLEYDTAEHFSEGRVVHTASNERAMDVTLSGVIEASANAARKMYEWAKSVATSLPSEYKRDVVLQELSAVNGDVLGEWTLLGAFPLSYAMSDYDQASADNLSETVVLKVDEATYA